MLPALAASGTARLVAVASRTGPPAGRAAFGAERASARYEDVIDDPDVEALYIPLPNSLHAEWTERAAAAGKHVLCEKPLARTADEAAGMARMCAERGVVLMEAYMTPFHPRSGEVAALAAGLGDLRFGHAAFTGRIGPPDDHRWRPDMGGGCLLDVGIYCVAPLLAAAGRDPVAVAATAAVTAGGVDASFAGWLDFGAGFAAAFECSFEAPERQSFELVGTEGAVRVDRAFTPGREDTEVTVLDGTGAGRAARCRGADPYLLMVEHMAAAVRGAAPLARPPTESVRLLSVLDRLAGAAGLAR